MKQDSRNESLLKQRHQEATRTAILEAAESELAERGLHGTRMEGVAARAGVSVGTIYNHLGDKGTLLAKLVAARRQELVTRVDEELRTSQSLGFEPQLLSFVRAVFDHFHRHLPLFRVLVAEEAHPRDATRRSVLAALVERAEKLVTRGIDEGALPEHNLELHATLLVGMIRGVLAQAAQGNLEIPGIADRVVSFFLAGARGG